MSLPFEITPVKEGLANEVMSLFHGERQGYVHVGPKKWFLPQKYGRVAEKYYNLKVRKDDVWIVTYPRTGTTVTSEMIWMLNNNLDYKRSEEEDLSHRFPFIDFYCIQDDEMMSEVRDMNKGNAEVIAQIDFITSPGYEIVEDLPSPRHIKTHLPFSLLPPDLVNICKVVYSARNPKDVCESYFHHNRLFKFQDYQGDFDTYWSYFKKGLLTWSPFWDHIQEGWELRNHPNVFFLFYEDFIEDMSGTIRKMSKFLNKPVTDEQVHKLVKHLQIENFREKVQLLKPLIPGITNGSIKTFVRQGKTGANSLFTDELLEDSKQWSEENSKRTGIVFPSKK